MVQNATEGHWSKVTFSLSSRWWKTSLSFPGLSGFILFTKISACPCCVYNIITGESCCTLHKEETHISSTVCFGLLAMWFSHLSLLRKIRNKFKKHATSYRQKPLWSTGWQSCCILAGLFFFLSPDRIHINNEKNTKPGSTWLSRRKKM